MVSPVKEIKRVESPSGVTILQRDEGRVWVERRGDRHLVSLEPFDPARHIAFRTHETRYPLELIESIAETKEFGNICDEMRRDEAEDYVGRNVRQTIASYRPLLSFKGKRILDFGCGMGASTMRLAQLLPESEIVGIELEPRLLDVAQRRQEFYGARNVTLLRSPSGDQLPAGLGTFDVIMFSALFEHLLPNERTTLLPRIWSLLNDGGVLFITETPHRWHFSEGHTTKLLFLNYLPDGAALWAARRFCKRYPADVSWEFLLREGIRGGSVREIMRILRSTGGAPHLLDPLPSEARDRIDIWFRETTQSRSKQVMRTAFKTLRLATGLTFVPSLSIAISKGPASE
jgi:predicted O-methyltransferase YrrM